MPAKPAIHCTRADARRRAAGARHHDRQRGTAAERGYDGRWQKYRRVYLARNPLCRQCAKRGRTEAATVIDHIVPHRGDVELFWDADNHQPLCKRCHDRKTGSGR